MTGSEGCIGSWVVRALVESGHETVACDIAAKPRRVQRILPASAMGAFAYVSADLTEASVVDDLVERHATTRIVHLAALQVPLVAADPVLGAEVNVVGTARVLEAARRSSTVRGLVYASSSAVFGASGEWGRADTLYGALKVCNEESARFYARDYGTSSIGLRPCVVFGPNRDQGLSAAVTHALKAAVLGEPYTIPFCGAVDLQYVEDVASAFVTAALASQEGAPVYDLHGDLVEIADVVAAIERAVPEAAGLLSVGRDPVPGRVEFDDAPLRAAVGPVRRTPLVEGIRLSVEHFRRQREDGSLTREGLATASRPAAPRRRPPSRG